MPILGVSLEAFIAGDNKEQVARCIASRFEDTLLVQRKCESDGVVQ